MGPVSAFFKFFSTPLGEGILLLILLGGLSFGMKHYYDISLKLSNDLDTQKVFYTAQLKDANDKIKLCSDNTDTLKKASESQALLLSKAQSIAASQARQNEQFAQELLSSKPQSSSLCDAANLLANSYLKKVQVKK
jgi:hypothetical protein